MFAKYDDKGVQIRRKVTIDCSNDAIIVEQSHKDEVNINNIIRRHGMDLIQKVAALQTPTFTMDELPNNDFMESMLIITKAQENFLSLPSEIRKKFNNNAAEFLDFVQNPANKDDLISMGLANAPEPEPAPVQVIVQNPPETPPAVEPVP